MHNASAQQSSPKPGQSEKQSFWWGSLALSLAAIFGVASLQESLWLDELHTDWVVSAGFTDVPQRAQYGNQSPVFFSGLWLVKQTLEATGASIESIVRLPSVVAWLFAIATIVVCLRRNSAAKGLHGCWADAFCLVALCLVVMDRIQWFYASEARVYGVVQLLSLLGWLVAGRISQSIDDGAEPKKWLPAVWGLLAILLVHVHLLGVLSVLWQFAYIGAFLLWRRDYVKLVRGSVWAAVVAVGSWTAVWWNPGLWERRQQWELFAGDATVSHAIGLFPIFVLLGPPVLVVLVCWVRALGKTGDVLKLIDSKIGLWCIAALGPWLTAWIVTAAEIAPVMHRRYVVVSSLPLAILAVAVLSCIKVPWIRLATAVTSLILLLVSQGTLLVWSAGEVVGWQRAEGWRQASAFVQNEWRVGDRLWCASGLIEAEGAQLPLPDHLDEYLSYPLRGSYSVRDVNGKFVTPHALLNDPKEWPNQFELDSVDGSKGDTSTGAWIVYRGTVDKLSRRIEVIKKHAALQNSSQIEGVNMQIEVAPRPFGTVSVAKLKLKHSAD